MARSSKYFALVVVLVLLASCGGSGGGAEGGVSVSIESTGGSNGGFSDMAFGGVQSLGFAGSKADLDFTASSSTSNFVLVVNSPTPVSGETSLQLRRSESPKGSGVSAGLSVEDGGADLVVESSEDLHHRYLREWERMIPESGNFERIRPSSQAALSAPTKVGDVQTFRVLSTLGSLSTYQEVAAKLRHATDNLLIYVDGQNEEAISDDQIQGLAKNFEGVALPRERGLFGRESDINADGHITVLMSCVVNRMSGSGGIVTGFFFPGDLYQRSDSNPASNGQEIFYTLVPDPEGRCGTPISSDFVVTNILPGVLAHEFQHMVSFNQHLFVHGGSSEEPWLNEALSHFAEDITGFGNENPSRVKLYLSQPSRTSIVPNSSPTLAERGGAYLFLRYLYEQNGNGDAFINKLIATDKTGVANLEAAFGGSEKFADFMNRWAIALALSETGLTSDPRYNYRSRSTHPATKNFTGVCTRCTTQDGRGTVLGGPVIVMVTHYPSTSTIKSTAVQFYRLKNPDGVIQIDGGGGSTLAGALIKLQKN